MELPQDPEFIDAVATPEPETVKPLVRITTKEGTIDDDWTEKKIDGNTVTVAKLGEERNVGRHVVDGINYVDDSTPKRLTGFDDAFGHESFGGNAGRDSRGMPQAALNLFRKPDGSIVFSTSPATAEDKRATFRVVFDPKVDMPVLINAVTNASEADLPDFVLDAFRHNTGSVITWLRKQPDIETAYGMLPKTTLIPTLEQMKELMTEPRMVEGVRVRVKRGDTTENWILGSYVRTAHPDDPEKTKDFYWITHEKQNGPGYDQDKISRTEVEADNPFSLDITRRSRLDALIDSVRHGSDELRDGSELISRENIINKLTALKAAIASGASVTDIDKALNELPVAGNVRNTAAFLNGFEQGDMVTKRDLGKAPPRQT